jgi:hypothetical protein
MRLLLNNNSNGLQNINPICVALAELLLQGAGQGKITAREFEALVENDSETDFEVRNSSASIVGYYLWTHGRKDKAVELWKTPARTDGGWNKILSCPVLAARSGNRSHSPG